MDSKWFDALVADLAEDTSRRSIVKAFIGGILGAVAVSARVGGLNVADVDAKAKPKGKAKRRKKVSAQARCVNDEECGPCEICRKLPIAPRGNCVSVCGPDQVCELDSCVDFTCSGSEDCDEGQECISGECLCTPASCDGCCDGDVCKPGTSRNACGRGGETCVACRGIAIVCGNGVCGGNLSAAKVSPNNMRDWFGYNDETDEVDNSLLTFVTGPGSPPSGTGSVQISVSGTQRRNIATYQFSGTPLADITRLKFVTYNPSAGNGGGSDRSGYLHFNVDFDGSDTWQRRLVFVPAVNGTVVQNTWQEWDAIKGGTAAWSYSGATWPGPGSVPGTTEKTWSQILSEYPGIRIRVTDAFVGIRVGEPYPDGYTENIDSFTFGTTQSRTFDFEPNA